MNAILGLAIGAEEGQKEDGGMQMIRQRKGEAFAHRWDILQGKKKKLKNVENVETCKKVNLTSESLSIIRANKGSFSKSESVK